MASNFREFNAENENHAEKKSKNKKKNKSGLIAILIVVFIAIIGLDSVYSIKEQEQGVVTTFGVASNVVTSGLHFKIPLIQRVTKVNTTIHGLAIGYSNIDNEDGKIIDDESLMITSDFNFVNIDFYVEYRVSDPVKYLFNAQYPEEILKNIAQSCIRNVVSNYTVDDVITTGKSEIQASIKEMIVEQLEKHDIGFTLVNLSMQDAEPPTQEVIEAFKAVETAKQGKETAINNANKYQNEKIPEAKAKADQIIQEAEAAKQERINEATAQVVRFNEMYDGYIQNPLITKQRMFYETMEDILPDVKLIIDDGSGDLNKTLYLDELQISDISNEKQSKQESVQQDIIQENE